MKEENYVMVFNPYLYSILIRQIDESPCFEARVLELPDIVEFASSFEEVYSLVIDTIVTSNEILTEQNKVMPPPIQNLYQV